MADTLPYQLTRVAIFVLERAEFFDDKVQLNIGDVRVVFSKVLNVSRLCFQVTARIVFDASEVFGCDDPVVTAVRIKAEEAILIAKDLVCAQTASSVRIESCPPFFSIAWPDGSEPRISGNWEITEFVFDPDVGVPSLNLYGDLSGFADRLDGLRLFGEAVGGDRGVGTFLNYWRIFESAFSLSTHDLKRKKLCEFLNAGGFDYERSEIRGWGELRDSAAHGDGKKARTITFARDVSMLLPRMRQAAIDVLMNKFSWRSPSVKRRLAPTPTTRLNRGNSVTFTQNVRTDFRCKILDPFTGWDLALDAVCTPGGNCIFPTNRLKFPLNITVVPSEL